MDAVTNKNRAAVADCVLDGLIARIVTGFARQTGKALSVTIQKVRTFADFLQAILASVAAQGVSSTAAGVFYDGTVYLVQENHRDAAAVEKTLFHELFGHAAVRALGFWDPSGPRNTCRSIYRNQIPLC